MGFPGIEVRRERTARRDRMAMLESPVLQDFLGCLELMV